ncbi:CST complex subunit CTC1-like [Pelmatolapia mariae]|uniref:CST complex subunit CTC1-like n=1 Tax=Pelmatolapia mariae TaxID=158779 RepID=UPI002FE669E9
MLDEPHTCPVTQYSVSSAVRRCLGVSELLESLQTDCWSSAPLSSLLPPDGSNLTSSQINGFLSWSCRTLSSEPRGGDAVRQRPLLLVGVLELPSQTSEFKHSIQLRDATGAAACVLTESSEEEEGAQRAVFNSAWIGCLVGVVQFTMVTERFLQSDFPSYQHLDQDRFITHKHCRVYLQFSLDHLHILSPSVAMETHLRHKGEEPGGDVTARKQTVEEEEETAGSKRKRREEEEADSGNPWPCVSMVIRVEQKEGVSWRNTGVEAEDQEAGLRLCFSAKAAVIGPVVSWRRDPKNEPMTEKESEQKQEKKVVLVFSGVCTRWFPVLQPGCFYRLIAANTQVSTQL